MHGLCQCIIPWKSLGGIPGSCFNGRDVIPWPMLVGVHGGALSI